MANLGNFNAAQIDPKNFFQTARRSLATLEASKVTQDSMVDNDDEFTALADLSDATAGMLRDIETYAFELAAGSVWRGSGVDPRNIGGHDLSPKAEFEWPLGTRALSSPLTSWTPGAYQR